MMTSCSSSSSIFLFCASRDVKSRACLMDDGFGCGRASTTTPSRVIRGGGPTTITLYLMEHVSSMYWTLGLCVACPNVEGG